MPHSLCAHEFRFAVRPFVKFDEEPLWAPNAKDREDIEALWKAQTNHKLLLNYHDLNIEFKKCD